MTRMIVTSRLMMCREPAVSRSSCRRLGRRYTEPCRGQYPRTGVARQHGPRGPGTPALWGGRDLRLNVTFPALSAASAGLTARSRTRAVGPRHARGFMEPGTERPGLVAFQGVRIRRLLGDALAAGLTTRGPCRFATSPDLIAGEPAAVAAAWSADGGAGSWWLTAARSVVLRDDAELRRIAASGPAPDAPV